MSVLKRFYRYVSAEVTARLNPQIRQKQRNSQTHDKNHRQDQNNASSTSDSKVSDKERAYYANLEIPPGSGFEDIQKAYRRLLKKYHPDKFDNDDRGQYAKQIVQKLNEAFNYFENKYKNK